MKIRADKVWDRSRRAWVALTPEEHVRQWFLDFLIDEKKIAPTRIATEMPIKVARRTLRADIVIFKERSTEALALVECKASSVALNKEAISQVAAYNSVLKARYLILTNGLHTFIYDTTVKAFVSNTDLVDLFGEQDVFL